MKTMPQWIAFQTIILREVRRSFRVWPQTLLPVMITSILYFFIFGRIIGQRIGNMSGFSYIEFIAPGVIMMQIITSSYTSTVSSFFLQNFNVKLRKYWFPQ